MREPVLSGSICTLAWGGGLPLCSFEPLLFSLQKLELWGKFGGASPHLEGSLPTGEWKDQGTLLLLPLGQLLFHEERASLV